MQAFSSSIKLKRFEIKHLQFKNIQLITQNNSQVLFELVSLDLPMNQFVSFQGHHGVGKSLLMKLMAGLYEPSKGAYLINDQSVYELTFSQFLPYRLNMGYAMENGGLLSNKTLEENLSLPLLYHEIGEQEERKRIVFETMDSLDLMSFRKAYPAELSPSYHRLTVIGRAMILQPQLLLLDNPTNDLRSEYTDIVANMIKRSKKSGSLKHVFLVSHDESFLEQFETTRMIVSQEGIRVNEC